MHAFLISDSLDCVFKSTGAYRNSSNLIQDSFGLLHYILGYPLDVIHSHIKLQLVDKCVLKYAKKKKTSINHTCTSNKGGETYSGHSECLDDEY